MPLELDQIYESLDDLNVALGPNGANRNGALSDLLAVTADNFDGQGATVRPDASGNFAQLTSTLDNNKEELFGSRRAARASSSAPSPRTTRPCAASTSRSSDVSDLLEGEKEELSASLRNLSVGARRGVDVRQGQPRGPGPQHHGSQPGRPRCWSSSATRSTRSSRSAPLALNNLALTYNPQAGTLDTRANLGELLGQIEADPATFLCGLTSQVKGAGGVCDTIQQVLPRAGTLPQGPVPARPDQQFDPTLGGLVEVSR